MAADSPPGKPLHLTICLNGVPWSTHAFSGDTKVNHVVTAAVEHFGDEGVVERGDFALALVVYGYTNPPLDDDTTLGEGHVTNGSMLTLIPRDA